MDYFPGFHLCSTIQHLFRLNVQMDSAFITLNVQLDIHIYTHPASDIPPLNTGLPSLVLLFALFLAMTRGKQKNFNNYLLVLTALPSLWL